uniref:Uncharacterized protein LOC114348734 n=1 Tax=Diabrotica virgifera virgifera TaxID=50390 RepID=A0A6P7H8V1_DIAVI
MELEHLHELKHELDIYEDQLDKVDIADLFKHDSEETMYFEDNHVQIESYQTHLGQPTDNLKDVPNHTDYQAILTDNVKIDHNLVAEGTEKGFNLTYPTHFQWGTNQLILMTTPKYTRCFYELHSFMGNMRVYGILLKDRI